MDILLFIQKYEDALKRKKITKAELYSHCGFSSSAVSQWKSGTARPSMRTIENVSKFLDIPMSELLEEKENTTQVSEYRNEGGTVKLNQKYYDLSDAGKEMINKMIEEMLNMQKESKNHEKIE